MHSLVVNKERVVFTKARIADHPIHPMLVAFPIALYTLTVVALFGFVGTHDYFWYRAATYANIAAIVVAVIAAVPGLIDLVNLPERSRARATGYRHAAFNALAITMFAISAIMLGHNWFTRHLDRGYYVLDIGAPLVLSIIGLVSTAMAGYLGWSLVHTHHVGVTPARRDSDLEKDTIEDVILVDRTGRMTQPPVVITQRYPIRH